MMKNVIDIMSRVFTILWLVPKAIGIGPRTMTPPTSTSLLTVSFFLDLYKAEIDISIIPINIIMKANVNNNNNKLIKVSPKI